MKALKITLLVALFVCLSSQTDKKPVSESATSYETTKTHYVLLAHKREEMRMPTQG